MTDLRKAAEMALESWGFFFSQAHPEIVGLMYGNDWAKIAKERTEALRQALAQPEQEQYVTKVVAVHEDGTYTTERIPLPKREWQGLMDEEIDGIYKTHHDQYGKCQTGGFDYERSIEAKLKEKNT